MGPMGQNQTKLTHKTSTTMRPRQRTSPTGGTRNLHTLTGWPTHIPTETHISMHTTYPHQSHTNTTRPTRTHPTPSPFPPPPTQPAPTNPHLTEPPLSDKNLNMRQGHLDQEVVACDPEVTLMYNHYETIQILGTTEFFMTGNSEKLAIHITYPCTLLPSRQTYITFHVFQFERQITDIPVVYDMSIEEIIGFFQSIYMYQEFLKHDENEAIGFLMHLKQRFHDILGEGSESALIKLHCKHYCVLACKPSGNWRNNGLEN
ncbi:methyltransferase DDB_G0268948 isoform X1 [Pelobates cultripes]|uniref:Methyltransferase DDB_G0268948 isoform X1 n=1 Tax=Pelobates cultripes TaxID=61616 RepID=A0AAD1SQJ4_PELCU|nr:methyltransferase DDB_G0268948 isoform X1 [Pelobates cultripes]